MRNISLLFTFLVSLGASADIDMDPVLKTIRAHSCSAAVTGKPLLLVVGLGNFGYDGTRHNIGEETVSRLARAVGARSEAVPEHWQTYSARDEADAARYMEFTGASSPRRNGLNVEYRVGGKIAVPPDESEFANIVFVHPFYDINESGHFVARLAQGLGVPAGQIVVVVDDLNLARNQVVLSMGKPDGSGDGHNGLKSINAVLQNGSYHRLRIGVSNPKAEKLDVSRSEWVLGKSPDQDSSIAFSDSRLNRILALLKNVQNRAIPGAHAQKLAGESSALLKQINSFGN